MKIPNELLVGILNAQNSNDKMSLDILTQELDTYTSHKIITTTDNTQINKKPNKKEELYHAIESALAETKELISMYSIHYLRKKGFNFYVALSQQNINRGIDRVVRAINNGTIADRVVDELHNVFLGDVESENAANILEKYATKSDPSRIINIEDTKTYRKIVKISDDPEVYKRLKVA